MQILFYYVEDWMNGKSENFLVKFFEFSPRIWEAYVKGTELCFKFSSRLLFKFHLDFL